jgi:hypothetical protein
MNSQEPMTWEEVPDEQFLLMDAIAEHTQQL